MKGLSEKEKKLTNTDKSVVTARGVGGGGGGGGFVEMNGDGRRLDLGQCTDYVLWDCAPETCIILLNSVTPIKFSN